MSVHRLKTDAPVRRCGERCPCGKWALPADFLVCDDHLSQILGIVEHVHVVCPACKRELRLAVPFAEDDYDGDDETDPHGGRHAQEDDDE